MDKVELMKIEDTFMVDGVGLVLAPSFELPAYANWKNIIEKVTIRSPEGVEFESEALFSMMHVNIKGPEVSISKRWPVVVTLRGVAKELVAVGSAVFVSKPTKQAVLGHKDA